MSTTYSIRPPKPTYELQYQHLRLGEYVERDDGVVGITVRVDGRAWRQFIPLALTQDLSVGVAVDCSPHHRYRRLNATVQIES